jgi:phosphonate transport system substrate-binding protein
MVADQDLTQARAAGDTAAIAEAERTLAALRAKREVQP